MLMSILKDENLHCRIKTFKDILPQDRFCPLLKHFISISHNSPQRNLFIFLGEPVFIKYGSPSVSSRVTTHKQRDIKSCLREPGEVKCLSFCEPDNGPHRGPSNADSSHKGVQKSLVSQPVFSNNLNKCVC